MPAVAAAATIEFVTSCLRRASETGLAGTNRLKTKAGETIAMTLDRRALDQLRELDPDGSAGVLAGLIDNYLSDAASLLQKLQLAFADKDLAGLARHAHSLKSTSASMGAMRVSALAVEIEQAAKRNAHDVCGPLLTALATEHAIAEQLLRAEGNRSASPS